MDYVPRGGFDEINMGAVAVFGPEHAKEAY
jgi:hypothetical protein